MKILLFHNKYQLAGGEDTVLENEKALLKANGHSVELYARHNDEIKEFPLIKKLSLIANTTHSDSSYTDIKKAINRFKPDICHVHNFFPLISPSVFKACKALNIPVVLTLHNFRLLCPGAYLYKDGVVCTECIEKKSTYNALNYGCYRSSKVQTYTVARMIEKNKRNGTWQKAIDAYIPLTDFAKETFGKAGFPIEKFYTKPNFLFKAPTPEFNKKNRFLFVGRLDETKGVDVLLLAEKDLQNTTLFIAGDGPLKSKAQECKGYLGPQKKEDVYQHMQNATAIIFPSKWYEGMPMTIIEAFACGTPVIASNLGAMKEMVEDGKTGLLFEPGNPEDLASKIIWAQKNPEKMIEMGKNARKKFEADYTADANYNRLMEIYAIAINNKR